MTQKTEGKGGTAKINDVGSVWRIDTAYIADGGTSADGSIIPGTQVQVKYCERKSKKIKPSEKFWSDSVHINLPQGHYLVFTWCISTKSKGKTVPYSLQTQHSCYYKEDNHVNQDSNLGFSNTEDWAVMTNLIIYRKVPGKVIGFVGDSITQGFCTSYNSYRFWVNGAADILGTDYGIWNLGSGWGHLYDAWCK